MKPTAILLLIVVTVSCDKFSKPKFDVRAEEAAVRAVMAAQQIAWNNGDLEEFMKGYWKSDSLQFIGPRGIHHGWQEALDGYKRGYPDRAAMGTVSFELLKVTPLPPGHFVVMGRFHMIRSVGNLDGAFTLVFAKIDGRWVAIYDHTC